MRPHRVKRLMCEGDLALVSHGGFTDPAVLEIIALAGFDGAFMDAAQGIREQAGQQAGS